MKRKYILQATALLFVAASHTVKAQTQRREILWQDLTASLQKTIVADPVNVRQFTIFQITDINKFLYKVEIKGSVFELETPVPSELQTLFRLTPTELQKTVENENAEEGVEKAGGAIPPMEAIKDNLQTEIEKLQASVDRIEFKAVGTRTVLENDSLKNNPGTIADKQELVDVLEELVEKCKAYYELSEKVAQDIFQLKNTRSELVAIAQMDNSHNEIKSKVNLIPRPTISIKTNYIRFKELYNRVEKLYTEAETKEGQTGFTLAQLQKIKKSLKDIEKADELIEEEALIGLYTDVDFLYTELLNKNNFIVVAPPVQMDGDLVHYRISITPVPTRTLGPHRSPMNFDFEVPTKGGLKVDFSVGPVISFGENAKDEKYYLEEIPGQPNVILRQRENNNTISPSLGALMHFYGRTGKYNGFGGMFGIGVGFQSTSSIDANLFGGVSAVLGKKQKLMLSAGVSYLRVSTLKNGEFKVDQQYAPDKIDLSAITEKVFKPSFFLSISYNVSGRVEIK